MHKKFLASLYFSRTALPKDDLNVSGNTEGCVCVCVLKTDVHDTQLDTVYRLSALNRPQEKKKIRSRNGNMTKLIQQ